MAKTSRLTLIPPFLTAAYPVVSLCAKNAGKLTLYEMLRPLGVVLLLAALLLGLSQLMLRNRPKSAVFSSLLLVMMFSFDGFRSLIQKLVPALNTANVYQPPASYATLALCIGIAALAFMWLRKTRRNLLPVTQYLTILGAILLLIPFLGLARNLSAKRYQARGMDRWDAQIARECKSADVKSAPNPAPDIYYIILDMYARPDVQKNTFGYDDSDFVNYLKKKGFYLAKDSHCNYPFTSWSMASSLNFEYLSDLDYGASIDSVLNHMIRYNRVARLFKRMGYKYSLVSSGWEVSTDSGLADIVLPKGVVRISEMERLLIKKSPFDILWRDSVPYLRPYVIKCFEDMAQLPEVKGPKFTFAHFVCPHEPWLFDREGNEPSDPATLERPVAWRRDYTNQVYYVNVMTKRLIDRILASSKTPPIIIIQADHGAFEPEFYTKWWSSQAARLSNAEITAGFKLRSSILNAYYLPGNGRKALYASISPVNTFRVVLNQYFGYHLKLLEDVSYIPKKGQCRNVMSPKDLTHIVFH